MKLFALISLSVAVYAAAQVLPVSPDPFLGEPFVVYPYDAGESAQYRATLIRYPFVKKASVPAASEADSQEVRVPKASVLYIHGFNDYFFQRELAEKMDSAGYAFYAIDLHKYGRSYREGEVMGELRDISEYYAELDSAIAFIHRLEGDSVPLVLLGHSTGGLIACLYAESRDNGGGIAALVLNSPFFEMNYPWFMREVGFPMMSVVGDFFPNVPLPRSDIANYGMSIHRSAYGEWDFDTTFKVLGSLPIDFGWLHAIHKGHLGIQKGLRLNTPIFVMHSSCSYRDDEWSEEFMHCDGVLNVEDIRNYGSHLGPSVEIEEIENGLHDIFLSQKTARDGAYKKVFHFLDSRLGR